MKYIIAFIILIHSLLISSQNPDSLKIRKHSIGISFSPDYSFRRLVANSSSKWMKQSFDTLEVAKFGFTTGINYQFQLNEKIELVSGLLLSDKGEKTKKQFSSKPALFNYNNHFYYLDIPLAVKYNLIRKNIKFFVFSGLSCNVFLTQKITQVTGYTNDDVITKNFNKNGYRSINIAVLAGCGMECPISKNWNFRLEPTYRYSLNSIANTPIKKHLYSVGLNFCLSTSL
jgi:hypothetical protein